MQTVTLSEGDKPYTVTACVVLCGKDIAVVIGGRRGFAYWCCSLGFS